MGSKSRIIPINYTNFEHSEVDRDRMFRSHRKDGGFSELTRIKEKQGVPLVPSMQGLDADILAEINDSRADKLFDDNVRATNGLYTHALPTMWSGTLGYQLQKGEERLDRGDNEVSDVGMVPEYDVSGSHLPLYQKAGWDAVLLDPQSNALYEYRDNLTKPRKSITESGDTVEDRVFRLQDQFGDESLAGIVVAGGDLRSDYLSMHRNMTSVDSYVAKLREVADQGNGPLVVVNDAEVPILNDSWEKEYELMAELGRQAKKGNIRLSGLSEDVEEAVQEHANYGRTVQLNDRELHKWKHTETVNQLVNEANKARSQYLELDEAGRNKALYAQISDVMSADHFQRNGAITLPKIVDGVKQDDAVRIMSDEQRFYEVDHVLDSVRNGYRVDENTDGLTESSQAYMNVLADVF